MVRLICQKMMLQDHIIHQLTQNITLMVRKFSVRPWSIDESCGHLHGLSTNETHFVDHFIGECYLHLQTIRYIHVVFKLCLNFYSWKFKPFPTTRWRIIGMSSIYSPKYYLAKGIDEN